MNNNEVLFPCLDSIINNTGNTDYSIYVVAYMYSNQNLKLLKQKFPKINVIKSNDFRGFSENHNLVLKNTVAHNYLVLNDDVIFDDNSIDQMLANIELPNIDILSPLILNIDGSPQVNGRPHFTFLYWLLVELKLGIITHRLNRCVDGTGIYKTCNVHGSAFLIKGSVMEKVGFFDERYFFTPEDIALSTKAIQLGFNCYVDTNAHVYHHHSNTSRKIHSITIPVQHAGHYIFFRDQYNVIISIFTRISVVILSSLKIFYWFLFHKKDKRINIMFEAHKNSIKFSFSKIPPKTLFISLYNKMIKNEE